MIKWCRAFSYVGRTFQNDRNKVILRWYTRVLLLGIENDVSAQREREYLIRTQRFPLPCEYERTRIVYIIFLFEKIKKKNMLSLIISFSLIFLYILHIFPSLPFILPHIISFPLNFLPFLSFNLTYVFIFIFISLFFHPFFSRAF